MVMGIAFGTAATVWRKAPNLNAPGHYSYVDNKDLTAENRPFDFPVNNERLATASAADFKKIPGAPIAYWVSQKWFSVFSEATALSSLTYASEGIKTGNNRRFLRLWFEVSNKDTSDLSDYDAKWFYHHKGGKFRKWAGNLEYVIDWADNGHEIRSSGNSGIQGETAFDIESAVWSDITSGSISSRVKYRSHTFDSVSPAGFMLERDMQGTLLAYLNSSVVRHLTPILNPTFHFKVGNFRSLPFLEGVCVNPEELVQISKSDWDLCETSWDFTSLSLLKQEYRRGTMTETYVTQREQWRKTTLEMRWLEEENNRIFIEAYGLQDELTPGVPLSEITLTCNPHYRYGSSRLKKRDWATLCAQFPEACRLLADIAAEMAPDMADEERLGLEQRLLDDTVREFISYAVGCIFGRYSLDKPGLILANQGETLEDYLRQVPEPTFVPDEDNVIPMLDGDWFADDVSERFKQFLRVTFGDAHYEENLAFVEAAIGRDVRGYFVREFYADHVKTYKKRPIYWLFSSPKGSFNALIYVHRYRPDTVSVVLNDYLREFRAKLAARRHHLEEVERSAGATQRDKTRALKEIVQIDKVLNELREYEDEVLFPLAAQQVEIDLDDGVLVNYNKFGEVLQYVSGLSQREG